jgi:hypothetical protein
MQGKLHRRGKKDSITPPRDEPNITARSGLAQPAHGLLQSKVVIGTARLKEDLVMNKIILTLAAVSTLAAASAASAQPGYGYKNGPGRDFGRPPVAAPGVGIDARQAMIARRIEVGLRNGSLTRWEADRLRMELRNIQRTEIQFRRTGYGLDRREIAQLDARLDRLSSQVRFERNNRQYGYGYGYR